MTKPAESVATAADLVERFRARRVLADRRRRAVRLIMVPDGDMSGRARGSREVRNASIIAAQSGRDRALSAGVILSSGCRLATRFGTAELPPHVNHGRARGRPAPRLPVPAPGVFERQ